MFPHIFQLLELKLGLANFQKGWDRIERISPLQNQEFTQLPTSLVARKEPHSAQKSCAIFY